MSTNSFEAVPLKSLDEWEEDVLRRYPDPEAIVTNKSTEAYRTYEEPARDTVKEFYRLNLHHFYCSVLADSGSCPQDVIVFHFK